MATQPIATVDEERLLLLSLTALKDGDFTVRLPPDWSGIKGKIADAFNEVVAMNQRLTAELKMLSQVVGKEGRITRRAFTGQVGMHNTLSDCAV